MNASRSGDTFDSCSLFGFKIKKRGVLEAVAFINKDLGPTRLLDISIIHILDI